MKTLNELINRSEPGWPMVLDWISQATRPCEVLDVALDKRDEALLAAQVSTRSPMGAIIYESAGLMIDKGWLRILGSGGHPRFERSLPSWNEGKMNGFVLIADDVIGGFFALNGGALGPDLGNVYYLAPDTVDWFPCKMGYSQFLVWALSPSLDKFYEGLRWPELYEEAKDVSADRVISFWPPLFAKEVELPKRSRAIVPVEEQFGFTMQARATFFG